MPFGVGRIDMKMREMIPAVRSLATDFGAVTTTSEAGTLNDLCGIVTTNTLDAVADANEVIVITNSEVAAGDVAFAQIIGGTTAGSPVILKSVCTASTITITMQNVHASAALDGTVIIAYMVVKALSASQLS